MISLSEKANLMYQDFLASIPVQLVMRGKTQKELASYLFINPANLSRIINGITMPSLSFYFAVKDFFSLFPLLPLYDE